MWGSDWPRRLEIMSTCLIFVLYFIIGSRPRDTKKQLVVFTLFIPKMGLGGKGGGVYIVTLSVMWEGCHGNGRL